MNAPDTRRPRPEPAPDDPRKPDSPTDLHKRSWKHVARTTVRQFSRDQCLDLAAALTYYAVLASAPALLAVVSLLGLVGDSEKIVDRVLDIAQSVVPADAMATLTPLVEQVVGGSDRAGLALVVGVVVALWSASGYVGAFGRSMNRMYEVEEGRPVWKLRPVMLLVTAAVVLMAALVVVALVLSGPVARAIGDAVGLGPAAVTTWNVAKWPVVLLLVILIVAVLYHTTPNVRQPRFRWLSVGAVVAILVWVLASVGFGFYVATFASYDSTYGALGGVIVFLLWLWITNLALLFGAELDAELERARELQGGIAAEETLQLPPRDTRASDKRRQKLQEDVERGGEIRRAAEAARTKDTEESDTQQGRKS
ncbi:YihY/virulence factor BrkB family protein [Oerskovia paurometabola]|uniref:YihY/virulence factor BrkB family protein n=1 Tax=Oerskovia paurometabola TaxID=162170 RepID=A0ABW1XBG0_9CELL|nr:YihY/virulence factor BrkB family protein [Oerskovia paurometabola]MBM7497706.1 membrane protein [Oerskovia paurometabola]